MDNEITKTIHIDGAGAHGNNMWPALMTACQNGNFGGNQLWPFILLLLTGRFGGLYGDGCGVAGAAGYATLQNALSEISSKMLSSQIALSDNIAESNNSLTQLVNANAVNTNNGIRDVSSGLVNLGNTTNAGFSSAAMERCAQTSKLSTDINQVETAVLASANQTDKTLMCGFNGLGTQLSNTQTNMLNTINSNFNLTTRQLDGVGCGMEKLSVQTSCQTKDILSAIRDIQCTVANSESRVLGAIESSNLKNKILELEARLAAAETKNHHRDIESCFAGRMREMEINMTNNIYNLLGSGRGNPNAPK